jgi:TonB family protein
MFDAVMFRTRSPVYAASLPRPRSERLPAAERRCHHRPVIRACARTVGTRLEDIVKHPAQSPDSLPRTVRLVRLAAVALLSSWLAGCASTDRPLQLVSAAGPVYPPQARSQGIEGYAVVRYDVDAEGRVGNVRVVESSPRGVFDESARQAVSRWQFRPAERNGQPSAVNGLESRLDFVLKGGETYADY